MGRKRGNYYWYGYGGVYVRRGKRATRYYIDYREAGKRHQVMVKSALSVEDALRELQRRARAINGGVKYATFREYSDDYMKTHAKAHRSERAEKSRMARLNDWFGHKDLRDISPSDVEAFRQARLGSGNSPATANRYLALLSRMFNVAIRDGYMTENPARYIKKFSEKDRLVERIISIEEQEALMSTGPQYLRDMIFVALHTGMREGEIMSLRWDCVDLGAREIRVEYPKSGKYRFVPIDTPLLALLSSIKKKDGHVFTNQKTGKPYTNIFKTFDRHRKKAKLGDVRFHDLRHTFLTRLAESGADIGLVQMIAGHSDLRITQRYIHPAKESALQAVEKSANLTDSSVPSYVGVTNGFCGPDKISVNN